MVIKRNEKGRAVYADRDYDAGEVVEACEVIVVPKDELSQKDILMFYVFVWGDNDYAVVLGNGSLYNHSYQPNLSWDESGHHLVFTAIRPIKTGEELTHNYNGEAKFARGESS